MKVIAVAMQKGGVGKSTIVRSLAVAAAGAGLTALVLEMDPQPSVEQWSRRRDGEDPPVRFVTELDLEPTIARMREAGCDLILIDTPPARSSEAPAAVEAADLVLIPCTPDIEAFEQLPRTAQLARRVGTPAFAILNLATPNSSSDVSAAEAVFTRNKVAMAPVVISRRKIHREAALAGRAAMEIDQAGKGAAEIARLWDWLSAELQLCTPAIVQNGSAAA